MTRVIRNDRHTELIPLSTIRTRGDRISVLARQSRRRWKTVVASQSDSEISRLQQELQRLALYPCRVVISSLGTSAEVGVDFGMGVEPLRTLAASDWLDVHRDPEGATRLANALQRLPEKSGDDLPDLSTRPAPI
jgi:hypothetical protein